MLLALQHQYRSGLTTFADNRSCILKYQQHRDAAFFHQPARVLT
jgi:hypothetical protein